MRSIWYKLGPIGYTNRKVVIFACWLDGHLCWLASWETERRLASNLYVLTGTKSHSLLNQSHDCQSESLLTQN